MAKVYLDYNATCPIKQEVMFAMQEVMQLPLNASSVHEYGRQGRAILDEAKSKLKQIINSPKADVIFTSGGTEANNLAVKSKEFSHIICQAGEHISVLEPVQNTANHSICPIDENGQIDLISLEKKLAEYSGASMLLCVMLANNETGVIQPLEQVSRLAAEYNSLLFVDATQALGKIAIDFTGLNISLMSVSGHKIGASQGVGALIYNPKALNPNPQIIGGGQEKKKRAGTENLAAIKGFSTALDYIEENLSFMHTSLKKWRDEFENKLKRAAPDITIFSEGAERIPNTTCFASPKITSSTQLIAYDMVGIMASNGAACSSGKVEQSHVLASMGINKSITQTAIRISTGYATNQQDYDKFFTAWHDLYKRTRNS